MSKTWLIVGSILAAGSIYLCAIDRMPSDVIAAALVAAIDRIFEANHKRPDTD
jgi:hypothetical protein